MSLSRRSLCQSIPLLLAAATGSSAVWAASDAPIQSFVSPFEALPVQRHGGNSSRAILNGMTHSGAHLEAHESTLAPGSSPHPPHHHAHEELFLISKGTLAITIAGKTTTAGPGSAAFIHSGEEHGIKNVGSEDAQYFVVAIGTEA